MKNLNQLAKEVALIEGGKRNLQIGDIKEVIRILAALCADDPEITVALVMNGRKKKRKKAKR